MILLPIEEIVTELAKVAERRRILVKRRDESVNYYAGLLGKMDDERMALQEKCPHQGQDRNGKRYWTCDICGKLVI